MRKVMYRTDANIYRSKSLREFRSHVKSFHKINQCNDYHGALVFRFIWHAGQWVLDSGFLCQINVVRGKPVFRRVKVHPFPKSYFQVVKP